jgi:hypothetical protein
MKKLAFYAIRYSPNSFPTLNFRFRSNTRNIITGDVKNNAVNLAIESWLDLVSAVMMFFAAIIPAYLSMKLKGDISKVTIALTAFIIVHGIYHTVRMQENHKDAYPPPTVKSLLSRLARCQLHCV